MGAICVDQQLSAFGPAVWNKIVLDLLNKTFLMPENINRQRVCEMSQDTAGLVCIATGGRPHIVK